MSGGAIRGGYHHVDLNVGDLAASRRVYGLVLEFLGYTMVKDTARGCEWDLRGPGEGRGASLGLRQCDPGEAGHAHRRYAPGLHHLAWRAESRADVDRLHALLVAGGVPVLDPPAHYPEYSGDYYAVFFEDPDGIKLELVYAPGWI
ncbi:VOC family protein [Sphingomonas canadensis]|uniref:VOC family protein n=1 Tax=Sphingomonas canadensis TaxID=1219257 RepID=A0ABW3H824_9SPHN|nr:VOC family protein [Sphingomonas canadensis]MCW3834631.1 VOC family protein [Sphingomonas canadensis]